MRNENLELLIKPMIPLTEGTKSNVNPAPRIPRPDFTPAAQGLPVPSNGPEPSSVPQPSSNTTSQPAPIATQVSESD